MMLHTCLYKYENTFVYTYICIKLNCLLVFTCKNNIELEVKNNITFEHKVNSPFKTFPCNGENAFIVFLNSFFHFNGRNLFLNKTLTILVRYRNGPLNNR